MITITREGLGRFLGYVVLTVLILGVSYAVSAFVNWKANPGQWTDQGRAGAVFIAFLLVLVRLFASKVQIVSADDGDE